jgi:DNA adenine methylase Dam
MLVETPFNYTGSKFKLLPQIIPHFDYTKPYFVDLFMGGGSVYTNVVDKFEKILANDIIGDLVGIHQQLLISDDIITQTKSICPDKTDADAFLRLREDYNNNPSPEKLWSLMLSCTSNMMRFNQKFKFNQTFGKRSWNSSTENKVEIFKNHIRQYKDKIRFTSNSFYDVNISSNKVMVYADPPYSNTEAGYNAYWKKDDDDKLYNYLLDIDRKGSSFMISGVLNHAGETCKLLDDLIKDGFKYKTLNYDYNKVSRVGKKQTDEIVIINY